MYPWAYYGSHQAGEVSNDVLSDQYDSQICANTANTMCVNTVCWQKEYVQLHYDEFK